MLLPIRLICRQFFSCRQRPIDRTKMRGIMASCPQSEPHSFITTSGFSFMSLGSDPRFLFFTLIGLIAINCNPYIFREAPFCTDFDVDAYINKYAAVGKALPKDTELGYV